MRRYQQFVLGLVVGAAVCWIVVASPRKPFKRPTPSSGDSILVNYPNPDGTKSRKTVRLQEAPYRQLFFDSRGGQVDRPDWWTMDFGDSVVYFYPVD
jgi:hypothetical protein